MTSLLGDPGPIVKASTITIRRKRRRWRLGRKLPPNFVGYSLAASLTMLIAVPILQVSLVGALSRIVPLAIVLLAILSVWMRGFRFRSTTPLVLLAMYLGVVAISTFAASDPAGPNQARLHLMLGASIMVMALLTTEFEKKFVAVTIVALATVEGAYAVYESLVQPGPLWGYSRVNANGLPVLMESQIFTGAIRAQGTLGQPLVLAFLMVVGIGLIIGFRPLPSFRWNAATAAVLVAGILASGSRSALVIACILLLFSARKVFSRLALGLYATVSALTLLTVFGFWDSQVYQRFVESDSLSHRQSSFGSIGHLLEQQSDFNLLFGNGFWSAERLYRTGVLPSRGQFFAIDNQFVATFAEVGIVGLLAMIGLAGYAVFRGDRRFVWAILAAFAMWWTFEVLMWPSSYAILIALVGLAAPSSTRDSSPGGSKATPTGATFRRTGGSITT